MNTDIIRAKISFYHEYYEDPELGRQICCQLYDSHPKMSDPLDDKMIDGLKKYFHYLCRGNRKDQIRYNLVFGRVFENLDGKLIFIEEASYLNPKPKIALDQMWKNWNDLKDYTSYKFEHNKRQLHWFYVSDLIKVIENQ